MKNQLCCLTLMVLCCLNGFLQAAESPFPGPRGENLDAFAREDFNQVQSNNFLARFVKVPRNEVVGFALYTHDHGVLKMTAQLFPLLPDEARVVTLELKRQGTWQSVAKAPVIYPGWSAHFRIQDWDSTQDVPYLVRHGKEAMFEGLIRKDPTDKPEIMVAGR